MEIENELFCSGKLVPLQPPPRLYYVKDRSSSVTSHSLKRLVRKGSSRRWNFSMGNSDDFDPFMVALEVVRNEVVWNEIRGKEPSTRHRRSRSFSPTRSHLVWPSPNHSVTKVQQAEQTAAIGRKRLLKPVSHTRPTMATLLEYGPEPDSEGTLKRNESDRKVSRRFNDDKETFRGDFEKDRCDDKLLPKMDPIKEPLTNKTIQKTQYYKQRQLADQKPRKGTPCKRSCILVCFGCG